MFYIIRVKSIPSINCIPPFSSILLESKLVLINFKISPPLPQASQNFNIRKSELIGLFLKFE